jgi:hypothetical protein
MVADYLSSGRFVFWRSLHGCTINHSRYQFLYYFKNYKVITIKNFMIANVVVSRFFLFILSYYYH